MLTKSQYLRGRDCPRRLWLDIHRRDLQTEIPEADLDRMKMGMFIGELARLNYPDGVLASRKSGPREDAEETAALIEAGHSCIFEATFVWGNCMARVDILTKGQAGWEINEVKSSSLKPAAKIAIDKVEDLAYQLMVVRGSGLNVSQANLVLVDTSYRWNGSQSEFSRMLSSVDLTTRCEKLIGGIERIASNLERVAPQPNQPEAELNTHCKGCDYLKFCFGDGSHDDVIFLPRITAQEVRRLRDNRYHTIQSIPADFEMNERQQRVRSVICSGRPYISAELSTELKRMAYPAAFVDFESANSALPLYPGTRPYEQICFQWSAHLIQSPHQLIEQYEFLATDQSDPRQDFCRTLWDLVKDCKSIVHYTKFEITQLKAMAEQEIPFAEELHNLFLDRSFDLEKIISEHVYFKGFQGRTSIKVVLPTLVPKMSYQDLRIGDGNAAACAFRRTLDPEEHPEEVASIRSALLEYCSRDTLAMVEIFYALTDLLTHPPDALLPD